MKQLSKRNLIVYVFLFVVLLASPSLVSATPVYPVPEIKINGSEGPLQISTDDIASITLSLDSGDFTGYEADWWVLAGTPFGYYSYDLGLKNWKAGVSPTHQGPLYDFGPFSLPNIIIPWEGLYKFYFAVDGIVNGKIDHECIYCDSVEVNVIPESATFIYLLSALLGIGAFRSRFKVFFR